MKEILFNPLFWITLIFCLSFVTKKTRTKKYIRNIGFALLFIFSNNWLSYYFFHLWEFETLEITDISEPYDVGIVLGPFLFDGEHLPNGNEMVRGENYRFTQAIQLYQKGKFNKLLLSGNDKVDAARLHLISICIPSEDIMVEGKSNNTFENALLSKDFLTREKISTDRLLLVTSASHMRRAKKCFDKVGLNVTPFSVDYWTACSEVWQFSFSSIFPQIEAVQKWRTLFREWSSMLLFKLRYDI